MPSPAGLRECCRTRGMQSLSSHALSHRKQMRVASGGRAMARRTDRFRMVVAFAALAFAASAAAQTYPARPIRLVVAQSTGGNADFVARAYSQRLAERFGQQIVVDNRPGGAGII